MRWLNNHWRTASVICLDFQGYSYKPEVHWEAPAHACAAGSAHVLRVTYGGNFGRWHANSGLECDDLASGLPRWVAGVLPLCQNLTALHILGHRGQAAASAAPAQARHPAAVFERIRACAGCLAPGYGEAGDAARERTLGYRTTGVGRPCLHEAAQGAHGVGAGRRAG